MKVYLAGPMRGIPEFNFPAFKAGAAVLRKLGHDVFNPAEKGAEAEVTADPSLQDQMGFRRKVFQLDTEYICKNADAVVVLSGWENSKGAQAEVALANAIGIETATFDAFVAKHMLAEVANV